MPKIYSREQREDIIRRLKEEANNCLMEYGVKKTTVDELVRRVGIPKGTFYLFYPSKEMLLFTVILEYHELIENTLLKEAAELQGGWNADALTNLICKGMNMITTTCIGRIMIPEEMECLLKKLPDEAVAKHLSQDDHNVIAMLAGLPGFANVSSEAISGAFRAVFFACQYQREIGEANFEESIRMLVKGLLLQIM